MADVSERVARHRAKQRYIDKTVQDAIQDARARGLPEAWDGLGDDKGQDVSTRAVRARAYAEWRWQGVQDGTVDSL